MDPATAGHLARMTLRVDPRGFVVVRLPPLYEISMRRALADVHAPFFVQLFADEQRVVLAEDEWDRVRGKFRGAADARGFRLITLETAPDAGAPCLEVLTRVMADGRIPVETLSSFHHDHLLVPGGRLDDAVAALRGVIAGARAAAGEPSPDA